jgi:ribosomal protein L29
MSLNSNIKAAIGKIDEAVNSLDAKMVDLRGMAESDEAEEVQMFNDMQKDLATIKAFTADLKTLL